MFAGAVRPDGGAILTGSWDSAARLWDAATGQLLIPPLQHLGDVNDVGFSPDGRAVVTVSGDNRVQVWDVASGAPLGPWFLHFFPLVVTRVAFLPDSQTLLMVGGTTARRWDVPAPVAGDRERIVLWAQLQTGMELDLQGVTHPLDTPVLRQGRQRLDELGGPP